MRTEQLEERLRVAGLRLTGSRVAVLRALSTSRDHPTVDEVLARVRASGTVVSRQAVYDVCEALHRAGLASRIEPAGSPARYEARAGDNHHHLVCRACGLVTDVDCAVGAAPCLTPSDAGGFVVDEAEVTWWGLCPACEAKNATERTSA